MNVLICGVTGTLGQEVLKKLLDKDCNVVGLSRDEQKQRLLPKHGRFQPVIGDIRDYDSVKKAAKNCDAILHLAALKCIDQMEENVVECIKTNIDGTRNIIKVQEELNSPKVLFSSTDKAVYPVNVYGQCKAVSEKLILTNSVNTVIRYGNVLGSRGSAVPIFIDKIKKDEFIPITSLDMTRFFITPDQASGFVVDCLFNKKTGLQIKKEMKAIGIERLCNVIAEYYGKTPKFEIMGLRPGEKLNEDLRTDYEGGYVNSFTAPQFTKDEILDLLRPLL